jgi:cellobiose epimerase
MNPAEATDYLNRIEDDLRNNILPFWMDKVANRDAKSFVGSLTNDLKVDALAERGALLTSRILWTYSAAYTQFGDPAYLAMAELA